VTDSHVELIAAADRRPMRFAVAVAESTGLTSWQQQIVVGLRASGARDIAYYTVPVPAPAHPGRLLRSAQLRISALHPATAQPVDWMPWSGGHATDTDFVLCFAEDADRFDLGGGTSLGSWSFAPGLSLATGLLEQYLSGQPLLTVGLYRDGPTAGTRALLHNGVFRCDLASFAKMWESVLVAVTDWPLRAAAGARQSPPSTRSSCSPDPRPTADPEPHPTAGRIPAGGRIPASVRRLRARAAELLRCDVWNVGVADWPGITVDGTQIVLAPAWLADPPRGHYLADPFVLPGGRGGATILAEDFDFASRTGRLVTVPWDPTQLRSAQFRSAQFQLGRWQLAIPLPHHASYPFLLQTADGTFCIPESLRAAEVAAWQRRPDGSWTKAFALVTGRRLVDPTVFRHNGTWWLFATDEDRGCDTSLHGWYAEAFRGPWRPHRLNPLKSDVRSSRPAGAPFLAGSRLVRPAQDCSRTYGGRIVLNGVVHLDETSFEEREIGAVQLAAESRFPAGPHTLSFVTTDLVLVDGKRAEWVDPMLALRRLPRRVAALSRQVFGDRDPTAS
jgi:hypothetical protein